MPAHAGIQIRFDEAPEGRLDSGIRRNDGGRRESTSSRRINCKGGTAIRSNDRRGKDAEFHREYKKLTGEDPDPLMPKDMEKAIREMPRHAEVIDFLKRVSAEDPLPAR